MTAEIVFSAVFFLLLILKKEVSEYNPGISENNDAGIFYSVIGFFLRIFRTGTCDLIALTTQVRAFCCINTNADKLHLQNMYTLKKSLGQHFLKDENICRKIISSLQEHSFSQLLEVGPGGGALTKYLVKLEAIDFKAVELDDEKVDYLLKTYLSLKGKIIHQSFLEIEKPFTGPFTVIGNFPYNISTQILFKILEWKDEVECVIGMFQKEVAQRTAAKEGNKVYGVLSVLVQAFFEVQYLFDVNEQSFTPAPKVKSGVIRLLPKKQPVIMKNEKVFFLLVKTAFNQRRKTLRNAVKGLFEPAILADDLFNKRAEQLTVQQFAELTFKMK